MLELIAKVRQATGRANVKLREQGFIPAVLYGQKVKNLLLSVKEHDFEKAYQKAGESTLIKLEIEGEKDRTVLIQDISKDPVNDRTIHIDFNQVKMDEKIIVEVPLVFIGQSEAVEREAGVLIKNIQEVEVEALPSDLPHEIEVDISVLKTFDDNIYIKDLKLPEKVEVKANPNDSVASVIPPRTQEELESLEEAP
ncbi:MAG: 50S ribosomal protein L25, partial [Candidatus Portnoybacteria bacterium]